MRIAIIIGLISICSHNLVMAQSSVIFWNETEIEIGDLAVAQGIPTERVQQVWSDSSAAIQLRYAPLQEASPFAGIPVTRMLYGGMGVESRGVMYAYLLDQVVPEDLLMLRDLSAASDRNNDETTLPLIAFGQALTSNRDDVGLHYLQQWTRGGSIDGALYFAPVKLTMESAALMDGFSAIYRDDENAASAVVEAVVTDILNQAGIARAANDTPWQVRQVENTVFLSSERLPASGEPVGAVIVTRSGWPRQ